MSSPHATMQMQRNVDRLVRSLVGVIDYAISWDGLTVSRLEILKDPSVEDHQLIRNVVSGLGAGCGVRLSKTAVRVETDHALFEKARAEAKPLVEQSRGADPAAESTDVIVESVPDLPSRISALGKTGAGYRHAMANGNGHRNGNGIANGNGNGHKPGRAALGASTGGEAPPRAASAPQPPAAQASSAAPGGSAPNAGQTRGAASLTHRTGPGEGTVVGADRLRLDRIEVENRGATLRCRVVLSLGHHIYSAIAEIPAGPTAEAEIAARVTLDALRAGALVCTRLDGIGFTTVAGATYVVAAVRESGASPRAGTAVLKESMANAAAAALLAALGPITTDHLVAAEQRLGSMSF
jgi:hypothetical protein